jgi:hypothetical protein
VSLALGTFVTNCVIILGQGVLLFILIGYFRAQNRVNEDLLKRVWTLEKNAMDDLIARNRDR